MKSKIPSLNLHPAFHGRARCVDNKIALRDLAFHLMAPIFIVSADRASEVWRIFRRPNIRQIGMYGGFTTGRSPHSHTGRHFVTDNGRPQKSNALQPLPHSPSPFNDAAERESFLTDVFSVRARTDRKNVFCLSRARAAVAAGTVMGTVPVIKMAA